MFTVSDLRDGSSDARLTCQDTGGVTVIVPQNVAWPGVAGFSHPASDDSGLAEAHQEDDLLLVGGEWDECWVLDGGEATDFELAGASGLDEFVVDVEPITVSPEQP